MLIENYGSFVACGNVVKDAETSTFGAADYHKTKLVISTSRDKQAPLLYATAVFALADVCASIRKGDSVFVAGNIAKREYNGKTYTDYNVEFVDVAGKKPAVVQQVVADENGEIICNAEEIPF